MPSVDSVLSGYRLPLLIGSMLGDASMSRGSEGTATLSEMHALDQKEYVLWKMGIWGSYVRGPYQYPPQKPTHQESFGFGVKTSPALYPWWEAFYRGSEASCDGKLRKRFPPEVVPYVTPFALAVWYMDDGSSVHWPVLSCHERNHEVGLRILAEFGIEARSFVGQSSRLIIQGEQQAEHFVRLVAPHMHPSMQYKLKLTCHPTAALDADALQKAVRGGLTLMGLMEKFQTGRLTLEARLQELDLLKHLSKVSPIEADLQGHVRQIPTGKRPQIELPESLLRDLLTTGASVRGIAKRFGVGKDVVKREVQRYGFPLPEDGRKGTHEYNANATPHITEQSLQAEIHTGLSVAELALRFECSQDTIRRKIKQFGLKIA